MPKRKRTIVAAVESEDPEPYRNQLLVDKKSDRMAIADGLSMYLGYHIAELGQRRYKHLEAIQEKLADEDCQVLLINF